MNSKKPTFCPPGCINNKLDDFDIETKRLLKLSCLSLQICKERAEGNNGLGSLQLGDPSDPERRTYPQL